MGGTGMGKLKGLAAGIFWALDTVVIGIALRQAVFCNTKEAVFLDRKSTRLNSSHR